MSIKKIQIRNFRTHKKLNITFSPHVNSIIGRNASGKSTIIRALKWVVMNKPTGDSIINWDAEKSAVRLTFSEDTITRTRSKSANTYHLNKKLFKAFGNNVPEEIEKLLGLSNINFQGQHDAPFWFCETAGEVSRQLNAIVNLEVIDKTLSNIDSDLRESKLTTKITKERLDKAKAQKKELAYAKHMDSDLLIIENLQNQLNKKAVEQATMQELLKSMELYQSEQKNAAALILGCKNAIRLGVLYHKVSNTVESLKEVVKSITELQKITKARPPSLLPITELEQEMEVVDTQYNLLKELIEDIKTNKEKKCRIEKDLKKCTRELEKAAEDRCPLCGKKS